MSYPGSSVSKLVDFTADTLDKSVYNYSGFDPYFHYIFSFCEPRVVYTIRVRNKKQKPAIKYFLIIFTLGFELHVDQYLKDSVRLYVSSFASFGSRSGFFV